MNGYDHTSYIYHHADWPRFHYDHQRIEPLLATARHRQGRLLGRMESLGFDLRSEAALQTLTLEAVKSNQIEGQFLDAHQVRSSIARRMGLDAGGLPPADRYTEAVVDLMLDATCNFAQPLSAERLYGWQAALFPSGRSGLTKITVGAYRNDQTGPMQVVSGPLGRETVHFQAPAAQTLEEQMNLFLNWFNSDDFTADSNADATNDQDLSMDHDLSIDQGLCIDQGVSMDQGLGMDPVLKAAIAHLWFVTIHPFDDGNGRIARALTDMLLARSDSSTQRFYSLSAQIQKERKDYYHILEQTQKGPLDITRWLEWFLRCFQRALVSSEALLGRILGKARFWEKHKDRSFNDRQRLMLNKLLDGFEGKLTSSKWALIAKCSQDTAARDISQLLAWSVMTKDPAGGRSTSYSLSTAES